MINLKRFFLPAATRLTVSKSEKEILEHFVTHKKEFEQWLLLHPQPRIRFRFYYPTAVDFYFDDFRLFTVYFKRGPMDALQLSELKMSQDNLSSIRTLNWKPFADVMLSFLNNLEASQKTLLLQKTKALHEYAAICQGQPAQSSQDLYSRRIQPNMATG